MRRLVIVFLCLTIAGCVLLLVVRSARRDRVSAAREHDDVPGESNHDVAESPTPANDGDVVSLASRDEPPPVTESTPYDGILAMAELSDLRVEVATRVDRRPLFAMAQARGLPNHELFSMSSEQLLDAILDAEGLPPADVVPSQQNAERIRSVMSEAFQRQDEYAAEEAASRDAG
jgi:hypothetical protein